MDFQFQSRTFPIDDSEFQQYIAEIGLAPGTVIGYSLEDIQKGSTGMVNLTPAGENLVIGFLIRKGLLGSTALLESTIELNELYHGIYTS